MAVTWFWLDRPTLVIGASGLVGAFLREEIGIPQNRLAKTDALDRCEGAMDATKRSAV